MTKITVKSETTIEPREVLNTLLTGSNVTAETVDQIQTKFDNIVMPWRPNSHMPPQFERLTATGKRVGLVDSWLGGYGDAHHPRFHGWGFKGSNPRGSGACTSGIIKVEWPKPDSEKAVLEAEEAARQEAMNKVDEFLSREFPHLVLLEDGDSEES